MAKLKELFNRHRRLFISAAAVIGAVLTVLYIRALFLPGLWFGDIFLYKKADGSFAGAKAHNSCQMQLAGTDDGAEITFTINGTTNEYLLVRGSQDSLQIYTNGTQTFDGFLYQIGDEYAAFSTNDGYDVQIEIITSDSEQQTVPDFPSSSWLANAAFAEQLDTRGTPAFLIAIAVCVLLLALDIIFPDLFYTLQHGLATDGGTPSSWFRFDQGLSRIVLAAGILIFMVLSFTMH